MDRQNRKEGDHKRERVDDERDADAEGREQQGRDAEADDERETRYRLDQSARLRLVRSGHDIADERGARRAGELRRP